MSLASIDMLPLKRAGLGLVVIGQGSAHVTAAYKQVMNVPFPMYADPDRNVYKALGMNLRTNDAGPACAVPDYVQSGMTKSIVVAIKVSLLLERTTLVGISKLTPLQSPLSSSISAVCSTCPSELLEI